MYKDCIFLHHNLGRKPNLVNEALDGRLLHVHVDVIEVTTMGELSFGMAKR